MLPPAACKRVAISLALAAWFLGHTWKGLLVYFDGDDMQNIYHAWVLSPWKILFANLTPFTSIYRPFGTAVYRVLFEAAGLHPLPYRIVAYAFLLANIWLLYLVAERLTGSAEIGVLAALLGSYHSRLMDLYLYGGPIYDVLCCPFFLLALLAYLNSRPWLFLISYVLALNSKEMAATLPLVLLAYEWIYERRPLGRPLLWISFAVTLGAYFAKTSAASPFTNVTDYQRHFTLHQFLAVSRPELAQLFFLRGDALNTFKTVAIYAAVWAIALLPWASSRRKALLFAAAFVTLTPLPIDFITYRGFFVMYLPLMGWAIYLATLLIESRDWLLRSVWKRPALPAGTWEPERVGLFLFVAYVLFTTQLHDPYRSINKVLPTEHNIGVLREALEAHPALPAHARVLLLHDPFSKEYYEPVFVLMLNYRDSTLRVDRGETRGSAPYDLVLDYDAHADRYTFLPTSLHRPGSRDN
jgi:hypothetical protein